MKIHIEGMGFLGSMLAWTLYRAGIKFTWYDSNAKVKAWAASTGCVSPYGSPEEAEALLQWKSWHKNGLPWEKKLKDITEEAAYWFSMKNPPNGGSSKLKVVETISPVQMGSLTSIHVNVQRLVAGTRKYFSKYENRGPGVTLGHRHVIAHGFNSRRTHYEWGWSAVADVHFSRKLIHASSPLRVCTRLQSGSNSPLISAYPVPGRSRYHYISGGERVSQSHAISPLNVASRAEFWMTEVEELSEGFVSLVNIKEFREGWKPYGKAKDSRLVECVGKALVVKPMGNSGVRLAPLVISEMMQRLED